MKRLNNRGITLIALVITIIVLLILAGVTIATLTGENGILTKASEASRETEIANEQEQVSLAYIAASSGKWGEEITPEDIQKELEKLVGENKTETTENGNGTINVEFLETKNNYNIDEEGKVAQVDKNAISYEVLYEYEEVEGGISITDLTDDYLYMMKYIEKMHENDPDFSEEFLWKVMNAEFSSEEEILEELNKLGISVEEFQSKLTAASEGIDTNAIYDAIEPTFKELLKEGRNMPKKIDGKEVVEIGNDAFRDINIRRGEGYLKIAKLIIPDTVKKIGDWAFLNLSIEDISMSNSLTSIGIGTFADNLLTNVVLPSSLTTIGNRAFSNNLLTEVTFQSIPTINKSSPGDLNNSVFGGNNTLMANSVKVPSGTIGYFTSETWWGVPDECFYE